MVDLDPRDDITSTQSNTESHDPRDAMRLQPEGGFKSIQFGEGPEKTIKIGSNLSAENEAKLVQLLQQNKDLFAWTAADMPGIDPEFCCHHLNVYPGTKPVAQKKRKLGPAKQAVAAAQVNELLQAGIIRELQYTTWLSNVVLVHKSNGKWRMCTDYTDLNKFCPKDPFPLPDIDRLVDNSSGYQLLSFVDAYSGYNQILMYPPDEEKTAFITDQGIFCYKMMPFGLKNAGATYQRMMMKVFEGMIGGQVEVYIDDIITKTQAGGNHVADLEAVFERLRRYNMRLNPMKCTFGVPAGKFLGYMLTNRGIEAHPDKCKAVLELKSPISVREVQRLNGRITALSRFMPKAAHKALPLYQLLRKNATFAWSESCEQAFQEFKQILAAPPILVKPEIGETLYLYLSVTEETISSVLIREAPEGQRPIYFVSKALQGAEKRYQRVEKAALALLTSARKLRPYFQTHPIVVRTNIPLRSVLFKPDLAGRMTRWAVELSEYDVRYEPRTAIKGQVLADFVSELTEPDSEPSPTKWTVHVDGSSNAKGSGAGIVLESDSGLLLEQSLRFDFPTSNNQAEYEACLAGLMTAKELGAQHIVVCSDSQLMVSQVKGDYQAKEAIMQKYLQKVREAALHFQKIDFIHVPRDQNVRADVLSRLASTKRPDCNQSIIQSTLTHPSITTTTAAAMNAEVMASWFLPIQDFIEHQTLPADTDQAKKIQKQAPWYTIANGRLYRRGFSTPLLKCLNQDEADYILAEIHEGICGNHSGGRSLARKILRAGYYWPTLEADAMTYVKKCSQCQRYSNFHQAPPEEMTVITIPWPFYQWGIDILGPFPPAPGRVKFLIVAIDYFTKWIEAEPLANITSAKARKFFKKNILSRYGIPHSIVTDNGTQFTDKHFKKLMEDLHIRQHFTSVEHPQTNGLAEVANREILKGLRKRVGEAKGNWTEELDYVLWAYRTTPHSSTGETPFRLAYGTDAVIPAEIGEPSWRTQNFSKDTNDAQLQEELDLLDERRITAHLRQETIRQRAALQYNKKVVPRRFSIGNLVLRRADIGNRRQQQQGKLAPNWEGPYRVVDSTGKGAYKLETLDGKILPRKWNAANLRIYYS